MLQYSSWKLEDLINEYAVQYPFLERLLVGLLYGYSSHRLNREEFDALFNSLKAEFIEKYGKVYFEPADTLLQILYIIGLLGVVHNERTLYESLGDKFILSYASVLEIHPAFRRGSKFDRSQS